MLDGPGDLILAVGCVASEPDGAGVVIFHYIYWVTPFIVSAMRPREMSMSMTRTLTFCPMLTTSAGDEMKRSLS